MTADRARGALAVLQDADGKFICEVPCGYIVEQTASAHKPRRIQAQRRRRAMLRRRVALTVALLTVATILAALMPWSGSGAADKPKDTTRTQRKRRAAKMKIKSIAAICKKNKNIAIFERYSDDGDILTQYIGGRRIGGLSGYRASAA